MGLTTIRLHIHAPPIEETFSASWEHPTPRELSDPWAVRLPLFVAGHGVGALEVRGETYGCSGTETIELLQELIEPFDVCLKNVAETAIVSTVGEHLPEGGAAPHRHTPRRRGAPGGAPGTPGCGSPGSDDWTFVFPMLSDIA